MADKKLSTEEILALARKQAAGGGGDTPKDDTPAPETPPAAESASESSGEKSAAKPSSTADILAAARAQKAAKPEGEAAKPSSTADILAAARAQKAGGGDSAKSADKPKSTADILAAARAGKAGGGEKPASKPSSTADILAAARAGKAGAPVSKPAATAKSPAAKETPVSASGDQPDVKGMAAALKDAQAGKKPKLPGKPVASKPRLPAKKAQTRRSFMQMLSAITVTPFALGWAAVGGIGSIMGLGMARFMMPNMVLELPSQFKIGPPSDFPPGVVSEKFTASRGVYIVNTDQYDGRGLIYALLSICTHLGCTPSWLAGEQKFKCPCHGSGFYITGINFEGPAPRPLERAGLRIAEDGSLEVDKSVKFQEELGQWSDPKSYVETV